MVYFLHVAARFPFPVADDRERKRVSLKARHIDIPTGRFARRHFSRRNLVPTACRQWALTAHFAGDGNEGENVRKQYASC